MKLTRGDKVRLTCEERTIDAEIIIASSNGKSLAFAYEAILAGFVGVMPVFLDDGIYRDLLGREVRVEQVKEGETAA